MFYAQLKVSYNRLNQKWILFSCDYPSFQSWKLYIEEVSASNCLWGWQNWESFQYTVRIYKTLCVLLIPRYGY